MNKPAYIVTANSISIIWDGKSHIITSDNMNYEPLKKALLKGEYNNISKYLNVQKRVEEASFGNIKVAGESVYYKNQKLHGAVVNSLLQSLREGATDVSHTIKFIEKLMANPSKNSLDQLYTFLNYKLLPITSEGNVIGYKGVDNNYYSIRGNTKTRVLKGIVNEGGHIFNGVGEEIIVARNSVDDCKDNHCSFGLHIGSYDYALSWAGSQGRLMMVEFDPADAVSVPTDSSFQKLRVCRYKVIGEVTQENKIVNQAPLKKSVYNTSSNIEINNDEDDSEHFDEADSEAEVVSIAVKNYVENKNASGSKPTLKQIQSRVKNGYSLQDIFSICTNLGLKVRQKANVPMSYWQVVVA